MEGTEGCPQAWPLSLTYQFSKPWEFETHDFTNTLSTHLSVSICKQYQKVHVSILNANLLKT